jgi:hypothetical protein
MEWALPSAFSLPMGSYLSHPARPPTWTERSWTSTTSTGKKTDLPYIRSPASIPSHTYSKHLSTITYWTSNVPSAGADQVFLLYAQGPVCVAAARSLNEILHTSTRYMELSYSSVTKYYSQPLVNPPDPSRPHQPSLTVGRRISFSVVLADPRLLYCYLTVLLSCAVLYFSTCDKCPSRCLTAPSHLHIS